ncbi:Protochlorophyllide-dependent translocon component 52, chloroplastic [Linum perenne]
MEAALATSVSLPSLHTPNSPLLLHAHSFSKPNLSLLRSKQNLIPRTTTSKFKFFSSSYISLDHNNVPTALEPVHMTSSAAAVVDNDSSKFDWYSQWYPVMPECDLDKRVPHGKKVLGIDVVVWWDKKQNAWKVFDDMCPHRLAPLSEGRIDESGRLQCVYHGWCFDGSGSCKLIPQAPVDGPPVHTNKRACVAAYPTIVQYGIVWFWPNSDPQYKNIYEKKKPPFIPELDDPSFTKVLGVRDFPYGYDVLIENLMDPAHAPYAHYGLIPTQPPKEKVDKEGGRPLEFSVKEIRVDGFDANVEYGSSQFAAPCLFCFHADMPAAGPTKYLLTLFALCYMQKSIGLIFLCIPVSPGNSRLIWAFPRNFDLWVDKVVPRWMLHLGINLVFDSDLHLLHVEEKKIKEIGMKNWQKACFVATKSDAIVIGFRKWYNEYSEGEVDWRGKYSGVLPPTPPREQLMDRYWTHVVNCSSCNGAYKNLKALETTLMVLSVGMIAIVAATKEGMMLATSRTRLAIIATICFVASRWLARFVYTKFRYHDYNHALLKPTPFLALIQRIGLAM